MKREIWIQYFRDKEAIDYAYIGHYKRNFHASTSLLPQRVILVPILSIRQHVYSVGTVVGNETKCSMTELKLFRLWIPSWIQGCNTKTTGWDMWNALWVVPYSGWIHLMEAGHHSGISLRVACHRPGLLRLLRWMLSHSRHVCGWDKLERLFQFYFAHSV